MILLQPAVQLVAQRLLTQLRLTHSMNVQYVGVFCATSASVLETLSAQAVLLGILFLRIRDPAHVQMGNISTQPRESAQTVRQGAIPAMVHTNGHVLFALPYITSSQIHPRPTLVQMYVPWVTTLTDRCAVMTV